jgi:hypothetical protein
MCTNDANVYNLSDCVASAHGHAAQAASGLSVSAKFAETGGLSSYGTRWSNIYPSQPAGTEIGRLELFINRYIAAALNKASAGSLRYMSPVVAHLRRTARCRRSLQSGRKRTRVGMT